MHRGVGAVRQVLIRCKLDMNFGDAYGTHVKELRLEQRSIFVVDADGIVTYVEYVPEIAQHPDYEEALAAVRAAVQK